MAINPDRKMYSAFRTITCLTEVGGASLDAIMQAVVWRTYKKGQIICLEGEPCPGLFIIVSGWIQGVIVSPNGRIQEVRSVGPGEMINEISVMSGDNNLLTLKSLDISKVWFLEREILFDLMAKHPGLNLLITRNLAKRVVQLLHLVEELSLRTVEGRLANLLLLQSKDNPFQAKHWSTREEMASRIGTTIVVVSRVLHGMENQGAIGLDGREINILNNKKLEDMLFQQYK
jgi:CRP-like cAMP-binding protein